MASPVEVPVTDVPTAVPNLTKDGATGHTFQNQDSFWPIKVRVADAVPDADAAGLILPPLGVDQDNRLAVASVTVPAGSEAYVWAFAGGQPTLVWEEA